MARIEQKYNPCPDALWNKMKHEISEAMETFIPRRLTQRKDSRPWIDKKLHRLMKTKRRLYKKCKKRGSTHPSWEKVQPIKTFNMPIMFTKYPQTLRRPVLNCQSASVPMWSTKDLPPFRPLVHSSREVDLSPLREGRSPKWTIRLGFLTTQWQSWLLPLDSEFHHARHCYRREWSA